MKEKQKEFKQEKLLGNIKEGEMANKKSRRRKSRKSAKKKVGKAKFKWW